MKILQHSDTTPSSPITVRRSRFQPQHLRRHYFSGQSPLISHVLTALSMTFPEGEKFFVHSVRQVRDRITDPQLHADISAFIGQEAMHSHAHAQFNNAMHAEDYPLRHIDRQVAMGMAMLRTRSPRRQLAATVAYEHFTALLSAYLLTDSRFFDGLDHNLQQLWLWHALEELEHKSVAFDVYQQLFGDNALGLAQRRRSMRMVSLGFMLGVTSMTGLLLKQDRKNSFANLGKMALNLRDAYYLAALILRTLPDYLAFYRADFHPNDIDHRHLITTWQQKLAAAPSPHLAPNV
jgi:predicted metal-dependent hydrolase